MFNMEEDNLLAKAPQDQKKFAESSNWEDIFKDWFKEWPNLKDTKVEEAQRNIMEEMPEANIKVVPFPLPQKFCHDCLLEGDRVWLFVDDSGIVRISPYTR